jgi:hypothetical protein
MTQEKIISKIEEATLVGAEAEADFKKTLCTACFMRKILTIRQGIVFLESKKRMTQKQNQPLASSTAKEVNHTSHWHQPSQSSSSNQPSHHNFRPRSEYQPNHHRYPSQYYQSYNFMPHTSQIQTTQPKNHLSSNTFANNVPNR